jgi:hypothetical protein
MIGTAQVSPIESGEFLISRDKLDDRFDIDSSGGVGDQLAREYVDPRIALERSVGQLRELQVVAAREILTNLAHLILYDVVVVSEPLLGRNRLRIATADAREKRVRRVESIITWLAKVGT